MRARALPVWAIGAAIAVLAIAAPARSGAAPALACSATAGVTIIVDFSYFHHDIERGCASGHPSSALAALHAAGFGTAGTAQYGDAFVCRINNLPTPAKESCAQTPPANASWAFYSARPTDAQWTYATTAVTTFQPAAGSIVAFAFGNYAKPGIRPSAAIASPNTTTTAAAPPPPTTSAPIVTVAAQSSSTTTGTDTPGTTAATTPLTTARTTTSVTPPLTRGPATTSKPPRVFDRAAARTASGGSSGSPVPVVLTIAIVAILGIGGLLSVNARRRSSS